MSGWLGDVRLAGRNLRADPGFTAVAALTLALAIGANATIFSPVIVLTHAAWRSRFGSAPDIVGRTLEVNRVPYTVLGVAPERFRGAKPGLRSDVFLPLSMKRQVWGGGSLDDRGNVYLNLIGRLARETDLRRAEREADLVMQRIADEFPDSHQGPNQVSLDPMWRTPFGANVYPAATLPMLLGLAAVVLLLACANVANLQLVRALAHRRESAVRLALGASRFRLVRQTLVESVLVALAGGVVVMRRGLRLTGLGLGLGLAGALTIGRVLQVHLYGVSGLDPLTFGSVLVLLALASLLASYLSARRATRVEPSQALRQG